LQIFAVIKIASMRCANCFKYRPKLGELENTEYRIQIQTIGFIDAIATNYNQQHMADEGQRGWEDGLFSLFTWSLEAQRLITLKWRGKL